VKNNNQSLFITEHKELGKVIVIKFPYSKEILFRVKNEIFPRLYIPDNKSWITPVFNIAKVISIFPYAFQSEGFKEEFNNQKLIFHENKKLKEIEYEIDSHPIVLYPHQKKTINYLVNKKQSGVLSDPGSGKSFSLIYTFKALKEKGLVDKALVLCPSSLTYNWHKEVLKTEKYIPLIIEGTKKKKIQLLKEKTGDFLITNFEAIINHTRKSSNLEEDVEEVKEELDIQKEFLKLIKKDRYMLIIDESHRIKGRKGKTFNFLKKLIKHMEYRYISTGTLIANKPEDAWSQFYCISPSILGTSFSRDFANKYCVMGNAYSDYAIVGYKNLEQLKFTIEQHTIRHLKSEVLELPNKYFKNYYITMGNKQKKLYEELEKSTLKLIDEEEDIIKIESNVFTLIEMASNPNLIDESFSYETEKLFELDKILEEKIDISNKKVVLWSQFIGNIKLFTERYKRYNPVFICGEVSNKNRHEAVEKFQTDDKVKLLIANPATGGTGLTMTSSCVAVFFDKGFSYSLWIQTIDRIHRIGQEKDVEIISLVNKDTIDIGVGMSLENKEDLSDYLTNVGIPSGNKKEILKKLIRRDTKFL